MTKDEYSEYLMGRHWRRFRMKVIRDAGRCEICGTNYAGENWSQRVEVHHWTYKNIPREKRQDVSRLCALCHKQAHLVLDGHEREIVTVERECVEFDEALGRHELVNWEYEREWFIDVVRAFHERANKNA